MTFLGSSIPTFGWDFCWWSSFPLRLKLLPVQGAGTGKHILLPFNNPGLFLSCHVYKMLRKWNCGTFRRNLRSFMPGKGLKRGERFCGVRHPSQCFKSCSYFAWFKPWKYAFRSGNCGKCICLAGDGKGDCPCGGRQRLSGDSGLYLSGIAAVYIVLNLGVDILCAMLNPRILRRKET